MICKHCGKDHPPKTPHFEVKKTLKDEGFPTHPKKPYEKAHKKANEVEKKTFPNGYAKMKTVDAKLGKHELAGKNLKSGKIEVSEKVPKSLRKEVAVHEKVENKLLRKK